MDETHNNDEGLINLWMSDRLVPVVQSAEEAIREAGFQVKTTVDDPCQINAYIYNGRCRGAIDVTRILLDVATVKPDMRYDRQLHDPFYEAAKIRRAIDARVGVAKILFEHSQDSPEALEKLKELTRLLHLRVVMVRQGLR